MRRALLLLLLFVTPASAGSWSQIQAFGQQLGWNGNLVQAGPWFTGIGGDFIPLDRMKDAAPAVYGDNSSEFNPLNMNANGYPNNNADLGTHIDWRTNFIIPSQAQRPGNYFVTINGPGVTTVEPLVFGAGSIVSAGTCTLSGSTISQPSSGTSCTATVNFTNSNPEIGISAVTTGDGPTSVQVYHVNDATAIAAGHVCGPSQFATAQGNFGVIRYLDKANSNLTNIATWGDRTPVGWYSYGASYFPASLTTSNLVTLNTGAEYTLAFTGFTATDKAHVIANLSGSITPPSYTSTQTISTGSTLTLNSVTGIVAGMAAADGTTSNAIYATAHVLSVNTGTKTVTFTGTLYQNGVNNGDTIVFTPMLNVNSTGYFPLLLPNAQPYGIVFGPSEIFQEWTTFTFDQALGAYIVTNSQGHFTGLIGDWPPEVEVQCANELREYPWFVSPPLALDPPSDYISSLASYVQAHLNSGLIPRFEITPNELWNLAFNAVNYANQKEFLRTGVASDFDNWGGRVAATNCPTIQTIYGNNRTLYQCIVGMSSFADGQTVRNGGGQSNKLDSPEYVSATCPGTPTTCAAYNYVTDIAFAGYWGQGGFYDTPFEFGWAYWYSNGASSGQQATLLGDYLAGSTIPGYASSGAGWGFSLPLLNNLTYTNFASYIASYAPTYTIGMEQSEGGYNATPITSDQTVSVLAVATGTTTTLTVAPSWTGYITTGTTGGILHVTTPPSLGTLGSGAAGLPIDCAGCATGQFLTVCVGSGYPCFQTSEGATAFSQNVGSSGSPIAMTGDNGWNYIYNTAGLSGLTTQIAGVCAALNGDQTILSATATTITVNVNTTGGCSYGGSGGTAAYDGSGTYLPTFDFAAQLSPQLTQYELTNLQNFYALGGRFPSEYQLAGQSQWSSFDPDVYQTMIPKVNAVQQFQMTPYLLKRDLDPASNDNTPVGLAHAA